LLAIAIVTLVFASQAADVVFKDDVTLYVQDGDKVKTHDARLTVTAAAVVIARKGAADTVVPFEAITGATYDRRARQRKFLGLPMTGQGMAGSAQKLQHFLTIQFKNGEAGDFVELELGKNIAPRVVSTIEARSGKAVEKIAGG
jgi:hypothetical protein